MPSVSPAMSVLASHHPEVVGCGSSVLTPGELAENHFQCRGLRQEPTGEFVPWDGRREPSAILFVN